MYITHGMSPTVGGSDKFFFLFCLSLFFYCYIEKGKAKQIDVPCRDIPSIKKGHMRERYFSRVIV